MRRTGKSALALPATALVCCLWLVVACAQGSPSVAPPIGQASPTPAVATPSPTSAATAAAGATASATAAPTLAAAPPTGALAPPPDGKLAEAANSVTGNHGSYCWTSATGTACVDFADFRHMPELAELDPTGAGAALTFTTDPSIEFISWKASYGTPDGELLPLANGGSDYDPDTDATPPAGMTSASFAGPPSGTWILTIGIHLVNGDDASYGWRVKAP
jgi:hypothetical protein